jgi:hypothetical protein
LVLEAAQPGSGLNWERIELFESDCPDLSTVAREAWAERLADWFDLQLLFVDHLVQHHNLPYADALTHYTALFKRLGFGQPNQQAGTAAWRHFVATVRNQPSRQRRLQTVVDYAKSKLVSYSHYTYREFGCFGFDPPDKTGAVDLHFNPKNDCSAFGALDRRRADVRKAELAEMVAYIRRQFGTEAQTLHGASWLYSLEAYRRLFPDEFAASARIYKEPQFRCRGIGVWGQFIDRDDGLKPDLRDTFICRLTDLKLDALWWIFPLPLQVASAPISPVLSRPVR